MEKVVVSLKRLVLSFMNFFFGTLIGLVEKREAKVVNISKESDYPDHTISGDHSAIRVDIFKQVLAHARETNSGKGIFDLEPRTAIQMALGFLRIFRSFGNLKNNPIKPRTEISNEELDELREFAHSVDVSSLGFTKIDPNYVFQGKAIQHNNAIVLTMEMEGEAISKAPGEETHYEIARVYNQLGVAANKIADWLRQKGFSCHEVPPVYGIVLFPPLAEKAGLGYRGLHGLVITPEHGSRVRLAIVSTNITNLPMAETNEHEWIGDFCQKCQICVKKCPSNAMIPDPIKHPGDLFTYVDQELCFPEFSEEQGCTICIAVCPFSFEPYDTIKASFTRNSTFETAAMLEPVAGSNQEK